jgi:hypothetical protein
MATTTRMSTMQALAIAIVIVFLTSIFVVNFSIIHGKGVVYTYPAGRNSFGQSLRHVINVATIKRGILVCAYDAMVPMTVSLIQELRTLGNTDLVQIYHCNGELSRASQRIFFMLDAHIEIIDGCQGMIARGELDARQANDFRSFWLKPLAVVHSRLDEIIVIDADDLVFQDPALLFETDGCAIPLDVISR